MVEKSAGGSALKLGTADAEVILSRFMKNGVKHPAYQAVLELGKVRKTIFLCKYLNSEALRQEIEEGLNVIENWNSANEDFRGLTPLFYGHVNPYGRLVLNMSERIII